MKSLSILSATSALCLVLSVSLVGAQTEPSHPKSAKGKTAAVATASSRNMDRVTLNIREAPLKDALNTLFRKRSSGYVLDPSVAQKSITVSAKIRNQPFAVALNTLLRSVGLQAVENENMFTITPRTPGTDSPPTSPGSAAATPSRIGIGRVSLDLHDAPLRDALDTLFRNRPVSYLLDPAVVQKSITVNASLRDQPFEVAFNTLLRSAGLRATRTKGVYKITLRDRGPSPRVVPSEGAQVDTSPVPDAQLPSEVPKDFAIRYAFGIGARNVLDTFKGTFTKDMVVGSNLTIPLSLTPAEQLQIYRKLAAIHFDSYPENFSFANLRSITPNSTYSLTVRSNHQTQTVHWDRISPDDNMASGHLMAVFTLIESILQSKAAYKKLPGARAFYS